MLTQPVERDIAISYSREIVQACDSLDRLDSISLEVEKELRRLEGVLSINGHFGLNHGGGAGDSGEPENGAAIKTRPLRIKITEGMIRQNLLTLTRAVKRGLMHVNEQVSFVFPDGEELSSKIMRPGNRLQERGRVRELYRQNNVCPGDFLVLEKTASGEWKLTIERRGGLTASASQI